MLRRFVRTIEVWGVVSALALAGCVEILDLDRFSIEEDAGLGADGGGDACQPISFYRDADGDGYGTTADTVSACSEPSGYVTFTGDCNDSSSAFAPEADEECDGLDQDCDGTLDEGLSPRRTFYRDDDGDGAGDETVTVQACEAPTGHVVEAGDCAPSEPTIFPSATETCDGLDQDCDTSIDEGVLSVGAQTVVSSDYRQAGFARVSATHENYAVTWVTDGQVHLARVAPDGGVLSDLLVDATSSGQWGPDVTSVDIADEHRLIVGWQSNGGIHTRVYGTDGTLVGEPMTIGTTEGDQRAVSLVSAGGRVLAAWFSGMSVEARFVEPTSGAPVGEEMSVVVATRTISFGGLPSLVAFTAPELIPVASSPFRALLAFGAGRGFVASIGGTINAEWQAGALTDVTPFFETRWLFPITRLPDGRIPMGVWGGNSDGTDSACATMLTVGDTETPLSVGECDNLMGIPVIAAGRGNTMTVVEGTSAQVRFRDVPITQNASGGPYVEVGPGRPHGIVFRSVNEGMLVYSRGTAPPYELIAQPIGCE